MSSAVVQVGFDGRQVTQGLQQVSAQVSGFANSAQRSLGKVGGGGFNLGSLSMQLQDVAVQAQMGANGLTIFAQQGSQMLSAFGAAGAVAGAFAAIGGAVAMAGQKSAAAFAEMQAGFATLNAATESVVATGTLSEIVSQMGQVQKAAADLSKEVETQNSVWGILSATVGTAFGGANMGERNAAMARQEIAFFEQREALQKSAVKMSEMETKLTQLRADGREEEADELERQLNLEREIAKIRQQGFSAKTTDTLVGNAEERAQAERQGKINEAQKRRQQAVTAVEEFGLSDEEKLLRLRKERDQLLKSMKQTQGSELEQIERATRLAEVELGIKQTQADIEQKIAGEKRKQVDEALRLFDLEADRQKAETAAAKTASTARADREAETNVLRLRADGRTREADAAARELRIRQEARQVAEQLNVPYKEAVRLVRERVELEERAERRGSESGRRRIQGFSRERAGLPAFSGLDQFYRDQIDPNFARPQTPALDAAFGGRRPQSSVDLRARQPLPPPPVASTAKAEELLARIAAATESAFVV